MNTRDVAFRLCIVDFVQNRSLAWTRGVLYIVIDVLLGYVANITVLSH
jgi:hypothetical protein